MPQYQGTEVLTVGKFDQARAVVKEWFQKNGYLDYPTPYKPGHEGPMWVLTLKGGYDWAIQISQDESVQWPPGVFAEPVNGACLGLYPATDPDVSSKSEELVKQWEKAVSDGNEWAQQKVGAAMAQLLREKG